MHWERFSLFNAGPRCPRYRKSFSFQLARLLVYWKRFQLNELAGHHVERQISLQNRPQVFACPAPGIDLPRRLWRGDNVSHEPLGRLVYGFSQHRHICHITLLPERFLDGAQVNSVAPDLDHRIVPPDDCGHALRIDLGQVAGGVIPLPIPVDETLGIQVGPLQVTPGQPPAAYE